MNTSKTQSLQLFNEVRVSKFLLIIFKFMEIWHISTLEGMMTDVKTIFVIWTAMLSVLRNGKYVCISRIIEVYEMGCLNIKAYVEWLNLLHIYLIAGVFVNKTVWNVKWWWIFFQDFRAGWRSEYRFIRVIKKKVEICKRL